MSGAFYAEMRHRLRDDNTRLTRLLADAAVKVEKLQARNRELEEALTAVEWDLAEARSRIQDLEADNG